MHGISRIKIATLILSAVLVFLVVINPAAFSTIRIRITDLVGSPLGVLNAAARFARRGMPFAYYRSEMKRLRGELERARAEVSRLNEYRAENRRLRRLLDFKEEFRTETIPARVIGRDPTNWTNSVIIDKGRRHHIRPDSVVLTTRGLVGRVVEVGNAVSKVLLITDVNSKVGVIIQKNRQGGLLVGRGDGKCKMIYISLDAEVSPGDKVITAGYGSIFPKGLEVGEVIGVGKEPGRLYKYAVVRPVQNLSKIEEVLCM